MKNFKKKWENYWYYHKGATILTIIFVLATVMLFTTYSDSLPQDGKVYIVSAGYVSNEIINFNNLIEGKIIDVNGDGLYSLNVTELTHSAKSSSTDQETSSQVVSSFSTGDVGLYIFDKTNLDFFMAYDAFEPLENLLPKDVINKRASFSRDGKTYAISLSGLGLTEKYNFTTDELYAAVIFDKPLEDTDEKTKQLADNSKVLLGELLK